MLFLAPQLYCPAFGRGTTIASFDLNRASPLQSGRLTYGEIVQLVREERVNGENEAACDDWNRTVRVAGSL